MSSTQKLGEFVTVDNEGIDNNLQSKTLTVGYVELNGETVALAFTGKELNRPQKRAKDNKEDIPSLAKKPPTHNDLKVAEDKNDRLTERHVKLQREHEFLKTRGFFARLFNVQYCEDCVDGKCDSKLPQ